MPSLKQSARVDMQGWEPAPEKAESMTPTTGDAKMPPRHPLMLAPMPLEAATGDAFQRQFYGGANIPTYRILPAQKGGSA